MYLIVENRKRITNLILHLDACSKSTAFNQIHAISENLVYIGSFHHIIKQQESDYAFLEFLTLILGFSYVKT